MIRRSVFTLATIVACLTGAPASAPARDAAPAASPKIRITSPRGGQTRERIVAIEGEVTGVTAKRLTLVLNGVPLSIPREGNKFSTRQVLAPGWNAIRVRGGSEQRPVEDQVAVFAKVPRKDLRITLTWDTASTDVDLWITGPDGEKVNYQNKQGKAGGTLDVDVTSGRGPETYTQARLVRGTYRIQAHYYGEGPPTKVEVTVIEGEGTVDERRRTFQGILLRKDDVLEVGQLVVP